MMEIHSYIQMFFTNLRQTSWPEFVAVITGMLSVWYARRENILVYPFGIISVLIYVWLCYHAGLYADMGINAYYFLMSLFGWYQWGRKMPSTKEHRPIRWSGLLMNMAGIAAAVIFFLILWWILQRFTNSTVPVLDSFTTALFIVGMWLMALKKIENWIYWIIGDLICMFLFPYKGLYFSGFQYLVFLILAVSGLIEWIKRWKTSQELR